MHYIRISQFKNIHNKLPITAVSLEFICVTTGNICEENAGRWESYELACWEESPVPQRSTVWDLLSAGCGYFICSVFIQEESTEL